MDALIARILEDPADLEARTVYADALTEAGDPRGELVTAQCMLSAAGIDRAEDLLDIDVDDAELARLAAIQRRVQQLIAKHGAKWTAELALPYGVTVAWRRGFPEAVEIGFAVDPAAVLAHLTTRTPIGELALVKVRALPPLRHPEYLRALAATAELELRKLPKPVKLALRRCRFVGEGFGNAALAALEEMPALREIALAGCMRLASKALVRAAAAFPRAVWRLPECNVDDAKVGAMLDAAPALRGLDLRDNPVSVAMLAKLVALPTLHYLGYAPSREITIDADDVADRIAKATAPLRWLGIGRTATGPGLTTIARAPLAATLRGFTLADDLPETGLRGLAAFPALVMLDVPWWAAEVGAGAIAKRPRLAHFGCEHVDDRETYRKLRAHFGDCVVPSDYSPVDAPGAAKLRIAVRCDEDDVSRAIANRPIAGLRLQKDSVDAVWHLSLEGTDLDRLAIVHARNAITLWWWRDETEDWAAARDALAAYLRKTL